MFANCIFDCLSDDVCLVGGGKPGEGNVMVRGEPVCDDR